MYKISLEEVAEKIGGPFRLTVLIQRRLKELKKGKKPLVKSDSPNLIDVIAQEILEHKIRLDGDNLQYEEDADLDKIYQPPLDDDDLSIGKGGNDSSSYTLSSTDD